MTAESTAAKASIYSRETLLHNQPRVKGLADETLERWRPREATHGKRIVWRPNSAPQIMFLQSTASEVLYGGAVGGGKTDALVMGALRWVYNPDYQAIILRREKEDLRENIDRAREVYSQVCPSATWVESRGRYEFPTGATVLFGHAQHEDDIEDYKTYQFSYVGFDELTTFMRKQYLFMISRNRVAARSNLPMFMRAGTNPDGPGHDWVYRRFVDGRDPYKIYRYEYEVEKPDGSMLRTERTRQFVPSSVFDNPDVGNVEAYVAGLQSMGKQLADALLYGRWDYFRGQMFPYEMREVDPGLKWSDHYVIRAMDYGWSDPSVVLWLVVYPRPGEKALVEVAQELVLTETNVDGIAMLLRKREEFLEREYGLESPRLSVIDPSADRSEGTSGGQSIREMLQAEGVWFDKANNDRQSGWAQIRRLWENGRLAFWRGECPYLVRTLPKLVRDPRKADDIRAKQDDHGADTLRYGVHAFVDMEGMMPAPEDRALRDPRKDPYWDAMMRELEREGRGGPAMDVAGFGAGW